MYNTTNTTYYRKTFDSEHVAWIKHLYITNDDPQTIKLQDLASSMRNSRTTRNK